MSLGRPLSELEHDDVGSMIYQAALHISPSPHAASCAAFTADSETTLQILLEDEVVVESWTGEQGSTALQEIPGLAGSLADEMELLAIMDQGDYIGITEVSRLAEC